MDWLFRDFPCMKFATRFWWKIAQFCTICTWNFWEFLRNVIVYIYHNHLLDIFWESELWILRTALITAGGSLFLFLITTQHSNIIYILNLLKNLLFLVSNRLHFLQDLCLSFKCMLHNSKNLFIFLSGVSILVQICSLED
jgi:hypothetical protein